VLLIFLFSHSAKEERYKVSMWEGSEVIAGFFCKNFREKKTKKKEKRK